MRHLLRKTCYEIEQGFMVVSFNFFVKNYYLNMNFFPSNLNLNFFFKYCRLLFLKTKNLKIDASHLKIAWYSKRQKKNSKKEKEKRKMKKRQKTTINIFYSLYFVRKYMDWFCRRPTSKILSNRLGILA